MSKEKKEINLQEEEVNNLIVLQNRKTALRNELADIGLLELSIEERKERAKAFHKETTQAQERIGKELTEKYGQGALDLDRKLFIPQD